VLRLRVGDIRISLLQERTLVGRSRSCDVRLREDSVSRLHAAFTWHDGRLVLEDLGSSNGTYVNGVRLADPIRVGPGDAIRFGGVAASVDSPADAQRDPASMVRERTTKTYTVGLVPGTPASLPRRLAALFLDAVFFAVGSVVPLGPLLAALAAQRFLFAPDSFPLSPAMRGAITGVSALLWGSYAWYYVLHGWARRAGTPGLLLSGLRLVDDALVAPIGYPRAWLRLAAGVLTTATLGLGFLTTLWRNDRKALHDLLAGTIVVHKP
jgi:uncharacterized RDD family membrane protein YckC